jgi:hypothetical protein
VRQNTQIKPNFKGSTAFHISDVKKAEGIITDVLQLAQNTKIEGGQMTVLRYGDVYGLQYPPDLNQAVHTLIKTKNIDNIYSEKYPLKKILGRLTSLDEKSCQDLVADPNHTQRIPLKNT